jgi:hypothetical protein
MVAKQRNGRDSFYTTEATYECYSFRTVLATVKESNHNPAE